MLWNWVFESGVQIGVADSGYWITADGFMAVELAAIALSKGRGNNSTSIMFSTPLAYRSLLRRSGV